jgi:hypothetical protein
MVGLSKPLYLLRHGGTYKQSPNVCKFLACYAQRNRTTREQMTESAWD